MEILELLKSTESLLDGHFELSSGLHSNTYFQCAKLLQFPQYAEFAGAELAKLFNPDEIDIVLGPALGGIIIGYETARALKKKSIFSERKGNIMSLRRGFSVEEGERILVVEDVITTARSVKETIEIIYNYGGILAGVACIVDRSQGNSGLDIKSLLKMEPVVYNPDECPLCKNGIELDKPGSKAKEIRYIS